MGIHRPAKFLWARRARNAGQWQPQGLPVPGPGLSTVARKEKARAGRAGGSAAVIVVIVPVVGLVRLGFRFLLLLGFKLGLRLGFKLGRLGFG